MRNHVKLGLTALIAALLLSAVLSTASARNLSTTSQSVRAAWSRLEFEGGVGLPVRCQITLEGSFHSRTITKTIGQLTGVVTRATIKTESCTNGRTTVVPGVWHMTYEGFTGTLPAINTIRLLLTEDSFAIERPFGLSASCVYGSATDRTTLSANLSGGVITGLTPDAGNRSSLVEARNEEFFGRCPSIGEFRTTSAGATVLNSTTRITITLI